MRWNEFWSFLKVVKAFARILEPLDQTLNYTRPVSARWTTNDAAGERYWW